MGVARPTLKLLGRPQCHLCDEMEAVLDEVLVPLHWSYEKVDIDRHPELRTRFNDVIPVLLRDGTPVAKLRLTRSQLKRILARHR